MRRLILLLVGIVILLFMYGSGVSAQTVNDFVVHDFAGNYHLSNDSVGGHLTVHESIDLTFSGSNRGILRAIPNSNRGIHVRLQVTEVLRDGTEEQFTTYDDTSGNTVIRIGDPDVFITGPHKYDIRYQLSRGVVNKFDTYDEWYWDINGTGWSQIFERVRGKVTADPGIFLEPAQTACYTGVSNKTERACMIEPSDDGFTFAAIRPLGPGETLTVAIGLRPVFEAYGFSHWVQDNVIQLIGAAAGVAVFIWAWRTWLRHGKDYAGRGTIIPEYEPPQGLTPTEVGLIADYQLHGRDITAILIDLAVRKYLVIHDDLKKRFGIFTSHDFSLELKKDDYSKLRIHEQRLLNALFTDKHIGAIVRIKDVQRTKMSQDIQLLRKDLLAELTREHGLFEPTGKKWSLIFIVLGSILPVTFFFFGSQPGWILGVVIAMAGLFGFGGFMQRRSHAGVEAYEKAKGLELYMKTAESDRMAMMQSVERPYKEPAKTFDLFEKLLPYAVALGVEKSWAKQFDGLFDKAPGWYQGNAVSSFHGAAFASNLTTGLSSMNQSFSAQSGSSGSGSAGGGSAGGGGGGGGGGGW